MFTFIFDGAEEWNRDLDIWVRRGALYALRLVRLWDKRNADMVSVRKQFNEMRMRCQGLNDECDDFWTAADLRTLYKKTSRFAENSVGCYSQATLNSLLNIAFYARDKVAPVPPADILFCNDMASSILVLTERSAGFRYIKSGANWLLEQNIDTAKDKNTGVTASDRSTESIRKCLGFRRE